MTNCAVPGSENSTRNKTQDLRVPYSGGDAVRPRLAELRLRVQSGVALFNNSVVGDDNVGFVRVRKQPGDAQSTEPMSTTTNRSGTEYQPFEGARIGSLEVSCQLEHLVLSLSVRLVG